MIVGCLAMIVGCLAMIVGCLAMIVRCFVNGNYSENELLLLYDIK